MSAHPEPARPVTTGMPGRSPAEIRRDINTQRQDLGRSVEALRGRVAELTDWRRQVREHRSQLVVGAAVAGFAIGGFLAIRRRR
ncbi:MAG TPA: DUF3618 domain-containing protein [Solirubrobacterales bacterium]|nr:DUF3618 domain-containing protein [Solirubrobacterales bacterium]